MLILLQFAFVVPGLAGDEQVLLDYLQSIAGAGGVLVACSLAFFGLVRVYKTALVQTCLARLPFVPRWMLWATWPEWVRWLVVLGGGLLGGLFGALATDTAVLKGILGGLMAAFGAMGVDRSKDVVVNKLSPPSPPSP